MSLVYAVGFKSKTIDENCDQAQIRISVSRNKKTKRNDQYDVTDSVKEKEIHTIS